jgi:PIN domain nuclease of toxin-antitoxin system
MDVLLDTHALVWWMEDASRLSRRAATVIANTANRIFISAAVGWELSIKVSSGKMKPASILDDLERELEKASFVQLPITLEMALRAGSLPPHHRDPFDRMLVAQAQLLRVPVVSADTLLDNYQIKRLW